MKTKGILMSLALAAAMLAAGSTVAQEESDAPERDMDKKHCVRVVAIDNIDIVNDDTLIFKMRGGAYYRNDLPHRCPGMRRTDTLMYRASTGMLCNVDIITVLDDWGFGFSPGVSCGLGMFTPVTKEEAEDILKYDR